MASNASLRVLYISYDGLLDPLGQSQILPYVRQLSGQNVRLHVFTFEKRRGAEGKRERRALRVQLRSQGITWVNVRYHKTPVLLASATDIVIGVVIAATLVVRHRVHVVHARSYVAAFMAWLLKRSLGIPFIFDMRGFWADERVEGGLWRSGSLLYRLVKRLETRLLADAAHVVTLTPQASQELGDRRLTTAPITVIPTCTDLDLFRPAPERSVAGPVVFVYSGSIGTWYLFGELLDFFLRARRKFPGARLGLITHGDEDLIRSEVASRGIPSHAVGWERLHYRQVPGRLAEARVGLAFYKPGYSRQATCPTKMGEYLACGLPVVINRGVGNTEEILEKRDVGIVIRDFTDETYDEALVDLERLLEDPAVGARCRQTAVDHFSLGMGVGRYREMYERIRSTCR